MTLKAPALTASLIPVERLEELDLAAASRWLERRLAALEGRAAQRLAAQPEQGVMHLLSAWCAQGRGVWIHLAPGQEHDPVVWGNALAQALQQATGLDLAGRGAHYRHALGLMTEYHAVFGPFRVALSGAELAPRLAAELIGLADLGSQVVLVDTGTVPAADLPPLPVTLGSAELALKADELADLGEAFGQAGEAMRKLSASSQGAFEPVWTALHLGSGRLAPLRPSPDGLRYPPGQEPRLPPLVLMDALTRRGQHLEALEVAVALRPDQIGARLEAAGWQAVSNARHRRLWTLLRPLPAEWRSGRVLFWLLTAAVRLRLTDEVHEEVSLHLSQDGAPDPDLRALAASIYQVEAEYSREAHAALQAARTPVTLMHAAYTSMLPSAPDLKAGVLLAREAVTRAQRQATPQTHLTINAVNVLTSLLLSLGEYREAISWVDWVAGQFQQRKVKDLHVWLNAALLRTDLQLILGHWAGLDDLVRQMDPPPAGFGPSMRWRVQAHLFHHALVTGNLRRATELAQSLSLQAQDDRVSTGIARQYLVSALLQAGENSQALEVAERTFHLAPDLRVNQLSLGRALALTDPERALPLLRRAEDQYLQSSVLDFAAISRAYQALALHHLGRLEEAQEAASQAAAFFKDVPDQALTYFVQPTECFLALLRPGAPPPTSEHLELRVLGTPQAILRGEPLTLPPRALDILVTLALHPEGLSGEQLLLAIYGDEGQAGNLKANISKLRRTLPIASQPYRLELPVRLDALEMYQALEAGEWRQALALYQGPLLPSSSAPLIAEWRERLEETLRQVVLSSRDGEGLYALGTRLPDLELLEAAALHLAPQDPRYPLLLSQIKQLRREYGDDLPH